MDECEPLRQGRRGWSADSEFNVGCNLEGGAAPDYPAAADWYRRAANAGHGSAAVNLSGMYTIGHAGPGTKYLPRHPSFRPEVLEINCIF